MEVGITGAEGRIGTLLRQGLADRYSIHAFTLAPQEFPSTEADISDLTALTGAFDGLDAVIHLAGDPSPAARWDSVLKNNIVGTYNVLEECRRAGVKKVVFATTNHTQNGDTMGHSPNTLDLSKHFTIRLNDAPNPTSLYGVSKLTGEQLGRYFSRQSGIQFVGLRIGAIGDVDDPRRAVGGPAEDYVRAIFLSRRDCIEVFTRALEVDRDFVLAYAISNNGRRIFDLRETNENIGFYPQDDAEEYFARG